jgi:uncharacterized protein (TIGR00266 family)
MLEAIPMGADEIDYEILGEVMEAIEIELDPGEGVTAEIGTMMYMEEGIDMQTGTGGMLGGLKRKLSGESFFITTFTNTGAGKQRVAFGAPYPGEIVPVDLKAIGGSLLCQKDAFLCAAQGITVEVALTKNIGAGLFGGEGFILQRLRGDGLAFIHAGGALVERELKQGELLRVETGCLVGFEESVQYNIKMVAGLKNQLFGAEDLWMTHLTGPGMVYLQTLPLSRSADRILAASERFKKALKK